MCLFLCPNRALNFSIYKSIKSSVENIAKKIEEECQTKFLKGEALTTTYTFNNGVVTPSLDIKGKLPSSGTISVDNSCKTTVDVSYGKYDLIKTKDGELATPTGKLKDKVDILLDGSDTYRYMDGTYLKGMQDSNYLWYSGNLYRIMGYDENNNVRLISEGNVTAFSYHNSLSAFSTSHLKSWLNTYFYNHIDNSILLPTSYCIDETTNMLSARTTCTNSVTDTKITALSLDEYRLATKPIEYSCNDIGYRLNQWWRNNNNTQTDYQNELTSDGLTCMEYVKGVVDSNTYTYGMRATFDDANEKVNISLSYLDDSNLDVFWTLTPYNSSKGWYIYTNGSVDSQNTSYGMGARPVITISSNIAITGGNGTQALPIMIEENNEKTGKLIDNAVSGEYVTLENKLYRVIENVDGVGTKLALDGFLDNLDNYTNWTTKMTDNTYLTELGLDASDTRLVNYTWDKGNGYDWGEIYTESLSTSLNTFQSKVGGIRIGEMYSSHSNSIPIIKRHWYWTITQNSSAKTWFIRNNSYLGGSSTSSTADWFSVRPALMISSDTTITEGNGTLDSPYGI